MRTSARHGYFVVQARVETVGATLQLSGVVENLATGGKWTFETPHELGDLLARWGHLVSPPSSTDEDRS